MSTQSPMAALVDIVDPAMLEYVDNTRKPIVTTKGDGDDDDKDNSNKDNSTEEERDVHSKDNIDTGAQEKQANNHNNNTPLVVQEMTLQTHVLTPNTIVEERQQEKFEGVDDSHETTATATTRQNDASSKEQTILEAQNEQDDKKHQPVADDDQETLDGGITSSSATRLQQRDGRPPSSSIQISTNSENDQHPTVSASHKVDPTTRQRETRDKYHVVLPSAHSSTDSKNGNCSSTEPAVSNDQAKAAIRRKERTRDKYDVPPPSDQNAKKNEEKDACCDTRRGLVTEPDAATPKNKNRPESAGGSALKADEKIVDTIRVVNQELATLEDGVAPSDEQSHCNSQGSQQSSLSETLMSLCSFGKSLAEQICDDKNEKAQTAPPECDGKLLIQEAKKADASIDTAHTASPECMETKKADTSVANEQSSPTERDNRLTQETQKGNAKFVTIKSPDLYHHVDYSSRTKQREAELNELRRRSLTKSKAARLKTAEAPGELSSFQEKQRELHQQQRQSERDARELLHQYRADGTVILRDANGKRRRSASTTLSNNSLTDEEIVSSPVSSTSQVKPYWEEKWKHPDPDNPNDTLYGEVIAVTTRSTETAPSDCKDHSFDTIEQCRTGMDGVVTELSHDIEDRVIVSGNHSQLLATQNGIGLQSVVESPASSVDAENSGDDPVKNGEVTNERSERMSGTVDDEDQENNIPSYDNFLLSSASEDRPAEDVEELVDEFLSTNSQESQPNSPTQAQSYMEQPLPTVVSAYGPSEDIGEEHVNEEVAKGPARAPIDTGGGLETKEETSVATEDTHISTDSREKPSLGSSLPNENVPEHLGNTSPSAISATTVSESSEPPSGEPLSDGPNLNAASQPAAPNRTRPRRATRQRRPKKKTRESSGYSWLNGVFATRQLYSR